MADAPVDGTDPAAETGGPARIPVSEPPEIEPDGEDTVLEARTPAGDGEGPGTGDEDAQEQAEVVAEEESEAEPEPEAEPAPDPEPEPEAEPAPDPAAETQVVAKPAAAKPAFDLFAPKTKPMAPVPAAPASPEQTPAAPTPAGSAEAETQSVAKPAGPAPIPVSEAPDLEAEAEEGSEPSSADATTVMRLPLVVRPGAEPEGAADQTLLVPAAEAIDPDAEPEPVEEPAPEPALLAREADETTLIPKVPEKPTESTTVMPAVASPLSDMARRPYSPAPAGYGSARQDWGGDEHGGPDVQATRVQPPLSGGSGAPGGKSAKRGYQPPGFQSVDPQRSQLPPPQNFKLDRREVEGEGGGRHLGRRALLVSGGAAVAAAAGLTAAGVIKLPGTTPKVPTVGFAPATNSGASSATQTGTAFLTAWQNGQFAAAANITDDPEAAQAALAAYKKNLGVVGMVVTPNAANAVGWMTYAVTTQAGAPMGQWQYNGGFATYSKQVDGYVRWFVKWDPQILYTSLKAGYLLKIKKTPATIKGLVDVGNQLIDPTAHPSLSGIITTLMTHATATGATDGQDIIMTDAKGNQLAKVATLTDPINNGTIATTLDLKVQAAAEAAVGKADQSSMVVIQPSTGHILAIANNTGAQFYDQALVTQVAPGSTFKIVTSAALLSKGLTSLDSTVPCPAVISIDSLALHNSEGESAANPTYEEDFAASCNNAFSSFWDKSGVGGNLLADTANGYFGLNQKWDIGLGQPTQYMTVPANLHRGDLAESLVGQGNILATPLAMCSVAATVASGSFKQPILLPKQKQVTATPLGSSLQGKLKTLMASVISSGTAAGIFPNDGHYYGKTGTAEVGAGAGLYNNSWFVVFHDQHDIAVCARAIKGGYGAQTAAPECMTVFKKLGYA